VNWRIRKRCHQISIAYPLYPSYHPMSLDTITIPPDVLEKSVGNLVNLSLQWLVHRENSTFRELISDILAHSTASGRSLVWLLRPAVHQIYQKRKPDGSFIAKDRYISFDEATRQWIVEKEWSIDVYVNAEFPEWAKPISIMTSDDDIKLRANLEKVLN
jgi:hypothetical protein